MTLTKDQVEQALESLNVRLISFSKKKSPFGEDYYQIFPHLNDAITAQDLDLKLARLLNCEVVFSDDTSQSPVKLLVRKRKSKNLGLFSSEHPNIKPPTEICEFLDQHPLVELYFRDGFSLLYVVERSYFDMGSSNVTRVYEEVHEKFPSCNIYVNVQPMHSGYVWRRSFRIYGGVGTLPGKIYRSRYE